MSTFMRRVCVIAVCLSAAAGVGQRAAAVPTRANRVLARPALVGASRPARAPVFRYTVVRAFSTLTLHPIQMPIRALPLTLKPRAPGLLPLLLPRAAFAVLLGPAGASSCGAARRPVLLEAVPKVPFAADDCARRNFDRDGRDLPPTSLVAGHDRNALYGRQYSPRDADSHK